MAQTPEGLQLTSAQRAAQIALRARSLSGLLALWRVVDVTNLADTIDVFTQAAVILALNGSDESAAAAGRYYELFRRAEGVPGAPPGFRIGRLPQQMVASELRGAALNGIINARRAGMSLSAAKDNGLVRVAGAFTKLILAGGRMTILGNVNRDRQALGWQRVTSGDPCPFCRMLAGKGAAYKTERAASFEPHDHCACTAEPFYRGDAPSAQNAAYAREFKSAQVWARESGTMSSGTSNDALNNYRRWLGAGSPDPGNGTATASPAVPTPQGGTSDGG
jgi:hypothetical protein